MAKNLKLMALLVLTLTIFIVSKYEFIKYIYNQSQMNQVNEPSHNVCIILCFAITLRQWFVEFNHVLDFRSNHCAVINTA